MPFYQMLCISVHSPDFSHIKNLVRQTALHVLNSGGNVRNLDSWGTRALPQRMRRHKASHSVGDYWTIHFDTSPTTLTALNRIMRREPRVIRWSVLNKGEVPHLAAADPESTVLRTSSSIAVLRSPSSR